MLLDLVPRLSQNDSVPESKDPLFSQYKHICKEKKKNNVTKNTFFVEYDKTFSLCPLLFTSSRETTLALYHDC